MFSKGKCSRKNQNKYSKSDTSKSKDIKHEYHRNISKKYETYLAPLHSCLKFSEKLVFHANDMQIVYGMQPLHS